MADVFTMDPAYLNSKRNDVKNDIAYARYKVGSTWYEAKIQSAKVLEDGRVDVTFIIDHTVSGNITVTAIELYDHNGTRIGSRSVSISRKDATEGILYVCRIFLFQAVKNKNQTGNYDAL